MLKIGILGHAGRMAQLLAQAVQENPHCALAALYSRGAQADKPAVPDCVVSNDLAAVMAASDVLIEFTTPAAAIIFAEAAAAQGKPLVSGTTGLDVVQQQAIEQAARHTALLQAANTSLSLAVTKRLAQLAAQLLAGADYDVGINDLHHRFKQDAPSGTAKALGAAVQNGNPTCTPHYAAQRLGYVVGEHQVVFAGHGEVLTISHSVTDRAIFARGAVRAACWLHGQPAGFYGMDDMMKL
jgi:4-hydroxy-tetrahydrodipicolinate reductase